jgi:hypothetical protein
MQALKNLGYGLCVILGLGLYMVVGLLMASGVVYGLSMPTPVRGAMSDMLFMIVVFGPGLLLYGIFSLIGCFQGPKADDSPETTESDDKSK